MSLVGKRIALAEGRQLEELAALLSKEQAEPLRYPLLSILDAPDPAPVLARLERLRAGQFTHVIFLTGDGVRRLAGFAERAGCLPAVLHALGQVRILIRGPKPNVALKEFGLKPTEIAAAPTTEGVIATLREEALAGAVVGVQLYSAANPPLTAFLAAAGAEVACVQPYVYAPASAGARVVELLDELAADRVDALLITSTPQVSRLFEIAHEQGRTAALQAALARTCVAAIGPVAAASLAEHGVRVEVLPEQGFVMKNLVQHLKRYFAAR